MVKCCSKIDLYGLGKGYYPKAKAPKPPFHPFCLCDLRADITKSAKGAKQNPKADTEFLATLTPYQQRGVLGSDERVKEFKGSVLSVVDRGKSAEFRTGYLGDTKESKKDDTILEMEKYKKIEDSFLSRLNSFKVEDSQTFSKLWNDLHSYQKHIRKRVKNGDIVDEFDYIKKTFATLDQKVAYYEYFKEVGVWDRVLYNKELQWAVVLGENGAILTHISQKIVL